MTLSDDVSRKLLLQEVLAMINRIVRISMDESILMRDDVLELPSDDLREIRDSLSNALRTLGGGK